MKRKAQYKIKYQRKDGVINWASHRVFTLREALEYMEGMLMTQKATLICVGYM